jgi:ADP-ribose pyrophosphatase YjhB (NUDIX family)
LSTPAEHKLVGARDYKFCPWCRAILIEKKLDGRTRLRCPDCDFVWYKNPVPAAGAIISDGDRLLLVKRKYAPEIGGWTLPAGFMEYDESPMECCIREIKEETGLDIKITGLFWNYKAGDDPRTMVVLILYLADMIGGELKPGDDAAEVDFFALDNLPANIAFSAHRRAIADYRTFLSTGAFPKADD